MERACVYLVVLCRRFFLAVLCVCVSIYFFACVFMMCLCFLRVHALPRLTSPAIVGCFLPSPCVPTMNIISSRSPTPKNTQH